MERGATFVGERIVAEDGAESSHPSPKIERYHRGHTSQIEVERAQSLGLRIKDSKYSGTKK